MCVIPELKLLRHMKYDLVISVKTNALKRVMPESKPHQIPRLNLSATLR